MSKSNIIKLVVLAVVVAAGFTAYSQFGDSLTLDAIAKQETALRDYQQANPWQVYGIAFLVYVVVTGLSLPGAAVLTLVFGWYFGIFRGILIVSFASTMGATLAFLLSRYLLRDSIQNKFGKRLAAFNDNLEREGAFYLFTLRLIPAVPFFVINVVMGLTPMKTWTFWWVSQIGMLAGTAVFVYAGSSFQNLGELAANGVGGILNAKIITAFVLLGVFPIIVKKLMSLRQPASSPEAAARSNETQTPTA